MKKITWFVIIIIIIIGGFYLFVYKAPVTQQSEKVSENRSIADIIALGKPYECSFSKSDGSSRVAGVIRIADGKVRGDFDLNMIIPEGVQQEGPSNFASHLIIKDGISYIWTSLQAIGYKSPAVQSTESNASPIAQAQIVGIEDKEDYACSDWGVDPKTFEPPSGITFLDLK
ncbi:MAG: hypothetical protein V1896_00780 [Candidatus Zambryskibacteria bacterium]